jgi:hypothetical protein
MINRRFPPPWSVEEGRNLFYREGRERPETRLRLFRSLDPLKLLSQAYRLARRFAAWPLLIAAFVLAAWLNREVARRQSALALRERFKN